VVKQKKPAQPAQAQAETDQRVQRSKEAVLAAAYALMTESGLGGVSVDAVSRRSGVAKTTIYRHWPSRSALLLDACARMRARPEVPDTGSLSKDLLALAKDLATRLRTARWPAVLPSIIDAAERDPELADLHARLHSELIVAFQSVVERGQRRGDLPPGREPSEVVACVIGPLFYRRWFSREPLDERFVNAIVTSAVGASKEKRLGRGSP
jgi:AcrR family transcriptional regulator